MRGSSASKPSDTRRMIPPASAVGLGRTPRPHSLSHAESGIFVKAHHRPIESRAAKSDAHSFVGRQRMGGIRNIND